MKNSGKIICFFFFVSFKALSQKDYIVTNKQDTLWGKIHSSKNYELSFSKIGSSTAQEYAAIDVVSYYTASENKEFQSIKLEGKKGNTFIKCLEKGKISLFESEVTKSVGYPPRKITVTTWYAIKDSQLFEVKTNALFVNGQKTRASLNSLFIDNNQLTQKYASQKSFKIGEIRSIIKEYNLATK